MDPSGSTHLILRTVYFSPDRTNFNAQITGKKLVDELKQRKAFNGETNLII